MRLAIVLCMLSLVVVANSQLCLPFFCNRDNCCAMGFLCRAKPGENGPCSDNCSCQNGLQCVDGRCTSGSGNSTTTTMPDTTTPSMPDTTTPSMPDTTTPAIPETTTPPAPGT